MDDFTHVLVALDLTSPNAPPLLTRAVQITAPSTIEAVHVCDSMKTHHEHYSVGCFQSSAELNARLLESADAELEQICSDYGITRRKVLAGEPVQVIHDYAQTGTDLVIVGSHGRPVLQTMFGSTSNALVHATPCDVLAVHISDKPVPVPATYDLILIAVDLGADSHAVIEHGLCIADHTDAAVALCHVYTNNHKSAQAHERADLETLADHYDVESSQLFSLVGPKAYAIHDLAKELYADLIVVGTHGKHGLDAFKGSTTNAIMHSATYDTLAVRVGPN